MWFLEVYDYRNGEPVSSGIFPLLRMLVGTGPLTSLALEGGSDQKPPGIILILWTGEEKHLSRSIRMTDAKGARGDGVGTGIGHDRDVIRFPSNVKRTLLRT
jgi:hypothetical protein